MTTAGFDKAFGLAPIESVTAAGLARLLDEEGHFWRSALLWDFAPTRERLEAALGRGSLEGVLTRDEAGPCGYATYSSNDESGVLGSLFVAARARETGLEEALAGAAIERLLARGPRVVDAQTLFSSAPGLLRPFAERGFQSAARLYLTLDRSTFRSLQKALPSLSPTRGVARRDLPAVARLVHSAHRATLDQDASSSFDTPESCEKILRQIVVDDLCGPFDGEASRRIEVRGETLSVALITWPLDGVAHVSEVATSPLFRRRGLGRRCLIEALAIAFGERRAEAATLSVTASNIGARALYASLGFTERTVYGSHVLRQSRP